MVLTAFNNSCSTKLNSREYLQKVLSNLDQIKSAVYSSKRSVSAPYDTVVNKTLFNFIKEYTNPADTFFGSDIASFDESDKMIFSL